MEKSNMDKTLNLSLAFVSDKGKIRDHNEDNFFVDGHVFQAENPKLIFSEFSIPIDQGKLVAIADGMGGTKAGEVASSIAMDIVERNQDKVNDLIEKSGNIHPFLRNLILEAHEEIVRKAKSDPDHRGMGTTVVLALLHHNKVHLAWCGDSRAYLYNEEGIPDRKIWDSPRLKLLTNDHSLVWEQVMKGKMNAEQARTHQHSNIITQSLGDPSQTPDPQTMLVDLAEKDRIILCSDGLNGMLPHEVIQQILEEESGTQKLVERLIKEANEAGGVDNITVIAIDVEKCETAVSRLPGASQRPTAITSASSASSPIISVLSKKKIIPPRLRNVLIIFFLAASGFLLWKYTGNSVKTKGDHSDTTTDSTKYIVGTPIVIDEDTTSEKKPAVSGKKAQKSKKDPAEKTVPANNKHTAENKAENNDNTPIKEESEQPKEEPVKNKSVNNKATLETDKSNIKKEIKKQDVKVVKKNVIDSVKSDKVTIPEQKTKVDTIETKNEKEESDTTKNEDKDE